MRADLPGSAGPIEQIERRAQMFESVPQRPLLNRGRTCHCRPLTETNILLRTARNHKASGGWPLTMQTMGWPAAPESSPFAFVAAMAIGSTGAQNCRIWKSRVRTGSDDHRRRDSE